VAHLHPPKAQPPLPGAPKQKSSVPDPDYMNFEWYVLKGENKFGPFAYMDLVKMLQEKKVFEFDYVWHAQLGSWTRMAELKEFQPQSIQNLQSAEMPELSEVFFRRRHKRASFNASILVHDNKSVWKGEGIEISAGGAGLYMDNAMLVPGQTLFLHFKPGDGVPPFNATCEIVSKKFMKGIKDRKSPIKYGVKFINIAPTTQEMIAEYAGREDAA
jgi:hypothetical protein